MAETILLTLKILHVLLAMTWLGGGVYSHLVLAPLLRQSTPLTKREFSGRLRPASLRFHNVAGGLTILSGALLLGYARGWSGLTESLGGKLVVFSAAAAVLTLYLVNTAIRSTTRVLAKTLQEVPPDIETPASIRFLQGRLAMANGFVLLLLVAITAAMVGANHLGY